MTGSSADVCPTQSDLFSFARTRSATPAPLMKSPDGLGRRLRRAQGGYFVINGSEKALIAQEKMSNNHVYVFEKRMPCKYSHTAEVRSVLESGNRPVSSIFVRMLARSGGKAGVGGCIRTTIPYIRTEIPIVIVFRALGFVVCALVVCGMGAGGREGVRVYGSARSGIAGSYQ